MIRVTTLFASTAGTTARYYADYLANDSHELPGHWSGAQAPGLGLAGEVTPDQLEALLSGLDPHTGAPLGRPLLDRIDQKGNVIKAVAGYDATFSAPKSVSVLWALTGDDGLAECHDCAVTAAVDLIEKYGSTTRIRSNGTRLHPETGGLTIGVFRQSTSRADDPQLHTHVVISAKVQTTDGRWYALDGRVLKRHQQAFGYAYQSALRAELTARYGVAFDEIVNGQAEIAGVPTELLHQFSKRAHDIAIEMDHRVAEFVERQGREPTDREYSAMEREASGDTRARKTGLGVNELRTRWEREAAAVGHDPITIVDTVNAEARRNPTEASTVAVADVLEWLAERRSTWNRLDVMRAVCDLARPQPGHDATTWARAIDRAVDTVLDTCIDLDPTTGIARRRTSDGRALHIEPVAAQATSEHIIAQEERIITWALDAQSTDPAPATTIDDPSLDDAQHAAASAVAGHDRLVLVVGPAGAGKTRTLAAARADLDRHARPVIGVAPTATAAQTLATEASLRADTIAKFLRDLEEPKPAAVWHDPGPGATIVVDEAGMVNTPDLARLVDHAEQRGWRLALIGDPDQLQPVGRGGMFAELCHTGRPVELDTLHRFAHHWEADASLRLRAGDTSVLDTYLQHDRIRAGGIDEHLDAIAAVWMRCRAAGESLSITTSRNEHVAAINQNIQTTRTAAGQLDPTTAVHVSGGVALVDDVVATRLNDRRLRTTVGDGIRNRERWTVTHTHHDGALTVTRTNGHGRITLPADYVRDHVELAYATTEHGAQGHTADRSITLTTPATTGRNLYVGMSRGRTSNHALVVTETPELSEAISILEAAMAIDRADIPAVAHRRALAATPVPAVQPRVACPAWFDTVRAKAAQASEVAQQALDERDAARADRQRRVAAAERDLPASESAHAPFRDEVAAAKETTDEAQRDLWSAEAELRQAGRLHRRSAQRVVDAASDHLAAAAHRLDEATARAEPTRSHLEHLTRIISHARERQSSERILDQWNDLEGDASRAADLCDALDHWKRWADGHKISGNELSDAAHVLADNRRTPGIAELAYMLTERERIEVPRLEHPSPSREIGFGLEL